MLRNIIKENIIDKENANYYRKTYGSIIKMSRNNTCSISTQDQHGPGRLQLDNVPIFISSVGTHLNQLSIGDLVDIEFNHGSVLSPKVTSVHFENYSDITEQEDHLMQSLILNTKEEEIKKVIPMLELYCKGNNKNSTEYYKNLNSIDEFNEECNSFGTYLNGEVGITNRIHKSTVKIDDEGNILVSVGQDCNFIVNNADKSITFNVCAYNINCNGPVNIKCNNELSIKASKDITMDCDNLVLLANEFTHHKKGAESIV